MMFHYPIRAQIFPTFKCNLSCKHCLYECKHNSRTMPFDKMKIVIEKLSQLNVLDVVINGGEPLLYKQFNDLVNIIYSKNFGWSLLTNATLLTQDKAKYIGEHMPYKVSISLHGGDAETHNWLTGGGYEEVIKGIENLRKFYDGKIEIQTLMHPMRNENEFLKLVDFCNDLNIVLFPVENIIPLGRAWKNWDILNKKPNFNYKKYVASPPKQSEDNFDITIAKLYIDKEKRGEYVCGAGSYELYIDPDGYTYPCVTYLSANMPRKRGSNILTHNPIDIWRYDPFLNEARSLHPLGCFYKDICPLWKEKKCPHCFGVSLQLFNSYFYPHPSCFEYIKHNIDHNFTPIKYSGDNDE